MHHVLWLDLDCVRVAVALHGVANNTAVAGDSARYIAVCSIVIWRSVEAVHNNFAADGVFALSHAFLCAATGLCWRSVLVQVCASAAASVHARRNVHVSCPLCFALACVRTKLKITQCFYTV